ncbi:cytochrome P450 4e3-like [Chironomus tepperi]|uniref:cytochrome P450 4e3-like n=1 Tax=Chironomus tepperi TaxID=113505 RepID=UPI00391F8D38
MGFKVNLFTTFIAIIGIAFYNTSCLFLTLALTVLTVLYSYWKNWRYMTKLPGGKGISIKGFFENSSSEFYKSMKKLWIKYGHDKFVVWIGFERFVTVSKYEDVKTILTATNDAILMDKYHAMWPWLGADVIRGNYFPCQTFTNVITSSALDRFTKDAAFVDHMSRRFGALCKHNMSSGDTVDIQMLSKLMMFDILYVIGTGRNISDQRTELLKETERLISMADSRIYSGLMQSSTIRTITGEERRFRSARNRISQIISAHLKSTDAKAVAYSVYDDICTKFPNIDPSPLIETFVLLGYDRFSIGFTNMIMELSKNAELQDEICSEIRQHQRNFIKSDKLHKFLVQQLKAHPIMPVVTKTMTDGVPLTGYFIPPNTGVLLYLENLDSHGKLMENSMSTFDDCMTMNLMKIFVGEFIVRFKFQMMETKSLSMGCGVSLRRKGVNVCVRNRY